MERLIINVKKVYGGWVCEGENGELPFVGRVHNRLRDAFHDLDCSYCGATWRGERAGRYTYWIVIDKGETK